VDVLPELDAELTRERPRLVRLCGMLTGNVEAAEDLAQETLLAAWRLHTSLREREALFPWLAAIARNLCLRHRRTVAREAMRRAPHSSLLGLGDAPALEIADGIDIEFELERSELADLVERALDALPLETRMVLRALYIEDRPHAEVAEQLGVSEGAVAMRALRGKEAVRTHLAGELANEAQTFGLPCTQAARPLPSRIWCPFCGTARLTYRTSAAGTDIEFNCSACRTLTSDRSAWYLPEVRGPRRSLTRMQREAHRYFRSALADGRAICVCCGRQATLESTLPPEYEGRTMPGIHVRCTGCRAVSCQPLPGLIAALPEVERFWREQGRIRMRPIERVIFQGRPAMLTTFEAVTSTSRLEVVSEAGTFAVLSAGQ
jgi:RNA polymerase sigma factor (sigma-70 family)